jgi:hypothetical protein
VTFSILKENNARESLKIAALTSKHKSIRDFMPKSEGKHEKTSLKLPQKKEGHKSSYYSL